MASVGWQSYITGSGSGAESLTESRGRVLGHEESGAKPFEADDVLILTSSSKSFRLASNVQPGSAWRILYGRLRGCYKGFRLMVHRLFDMPLSRIMSAQCMQ